MAYISTVFLAPQASICLLQLGQKRKTVFVEFTKTSSVIGTANAIRIGIDKLSRFINCLATLNTQRIHYRVLDKKEIIIGSPVEHFSIIFHNSLVNPILPL